MKIGRILGRWWNKNLDKIAWVKSNITSLQLWTLYRRFTTCRRRLGWQIAVNFGEFQLLAQI